MRGYVTARVLNVRETPDTKKPPLLGQLSGGDEIWIYAREGAWYRIGPGRWVHGDYVRIIDAPSGYLRDHSGLQTVDLAPTGSREGRGPIVSTWNRLGGLLSAAAGTMGLEPAVALAVLLVESGGRGFGEYGLLKIRFENHIFWERWGKDHEEDFSDYFRFDAKKRWTKHQYRHNGVRDVWQPVHIGSQFREHAAFSVACSLDSRAAYLSISMGGAQIMGFNHHLIGYGSPEAMYERFSADERWQVLGLFDFIKGPGSTSPMLEALRRGRWTDFAAHYNGPGQAARYGSLIEQRLSAVRKVLG